jgi:hypothetical protein
MGVLVWNEAGEILRWFKADIVGKNCKNITTKQIVDGVVRFCRENEAIFAPCDRIYIETQMTSRFRTVQVALAASLSASSDVQFVSASAYKIHLGLATGNHASNKTASVEAMLRDASEGAKGMISDQSKLDDLADVYWMMKYVNRPVKNKKKKT